MSRIQFTRYQRAKTARAWRVHRAGRKHKAHGYACPVCRCRTRRVIGGAS